MCGHKKNVLLFMGLLPGQELHKHRGEQAVNTSVGVGTSAGLCGGGSPRKGFPRWRVEADGAGGYGEAWASTPRASLSQQRCIGRGGAEPKQESQGRGQMDKQMNRLEI